MSRFKLSGVVLFSAILGFLIAVFMYEWITVDSRQKVEVRIDDYQALKREVDDWEKLISGADSHDFISLLEYLETNDSEKAKSFLVDRLSHHYKVAIEDSENSDNEEFYKALRMSNSQWIERIDELSKELESFKEIRENGRKDS